MLTEWEISMIDALASMISTDEMFIFLVSFFVFVLIIGVSQLVKKM